MSYPMVPCLAYATVRPLLAPGDLLLCSGSSFFSRLIQRATGSVWSHVAVLYFVRDLDRWLVIESVESVGVRPVLLRHYLQDYQGHGVRYPGRLFIARHAACAALGPPAWQAFALFAMLKFGYAYNPQEIARIAARIAAPWLTAGLEEDGEDRTYICSQYAAACFEAVGITVRSQTRGYITPADFAADPAVELLYELA